MNQKRKIKISILLGIMCMFLTLGISIQIHTVKNSTTTVGRTLVENELRDSVLRWKQKYENSYAKLESKEQELEGLRQKASSRDDNASDLTAKLDEYNVLLGNTELTGKGIEITLKDGDSSILKGSVTDLVVHDGDILEVVNALKNAKAEAISVNDQRIVSTTAITCIGNVVKINREKVGAPYVIKAIGNPSMLLGAVTMAGGYIEILEKDGVQVEIKQVEKEKDSITIPKYNGIYKFEYGTIYE